MPVGSPWNSLEIAKLAIAFLTPLLLLGLGILVTRATKRIEDAQWANRKLIEKRLEVYEAMAPLLNDLYCFFRFIGNFQEITPPRAVQLKRELDKLFYVSRFLFDDAFADRYRDFIEGCFVTYTGTAQPAKLRALADWQRQERAERWQHDWRACFAPDEAATDLRVLVGLYEELMSAFAVNVGVTHTSLRGRTRS